MVWTSFVPALGVVNFALSDGAVLWIVSEGAQEIPIGGGGPAIPISPEAFADALVDSVGAEAALEALFFALERGYSFEQIATGAEGGVLNADGTIEATVPAGPPLGLVLLPEAGLARLIASQTERVTGEELVERASELFGLGKERFEEEQEGVDQTKRDMAFRVLLISTMGLLLENGYTPEQVTLQIIVGGAVLLLDDPRPESEKQCIYMRDILPDGTGGPIVAPDQSSERNPSCEIIIRDALDREASEDDDTGDTGDDDTSCPQGFAEELDPCVEDDAEADDETPAPMGQPIIITERGTVSASTTFNDDPAFAPEFAVDNDEQTSWFSAGTGPDGTSVFTWTGERDFHISFVTIIGNLFHATEAFQEGFYFGRVEVRLETLDGEILASQERTRSTERSSSFGFVAFGDVLARRVVLVFSEHEAPNRGGFSDVIIRGFEP